MWFAKRTATFYKSVWYLYLKKRDNGFKGIWVKLPPAFFFRKRKCFDTVALVCSSLADKQKTNKKKLKEIAMQYAHR